MRDKLFDAMFGEGGLLRVRAALAFILTGGITYMWMNGDEVPEAMLGLAAGAVGFYFASRSG